MAACQHPHAEVTEETAAFKVTSDNWSIERHGTVQPVQFTVLYCNNCDSILESDIGEAYPVNRLNRVIEDDDADDCPHSWSEVIETNLYVDVLETSFRDETVRDEFQVAICTTCNRVIDAGGRETIPLPLD